MNINDDISFSLEQPESQRDAFRALVRGLQVRVLENNAVHDIHDISSIGCRLDACKGTYTTGRILHMHLEVKGKVILADIQARVVRCTPDRIMACSFQELTRVQEYALDKLVLEIQKRQIAMRRELSRSAEDVPPPPQEPHP